MLMITMGGEVNLRLDRILVSHPRKEPARLQRDKKKVKEKLTILSFIVASTFSLGYRSGKSVRLGCLSSSSLGVVRLVVCAIFCGFLESAVVCVAGGLVLGLCPRLGESRL